MQKLKNKKLPTNKKVKINTGAFAMEGALFGLQIPLNLKDCINLRNGASKEVVKELDAMALKEMSSYSELHKQSGAINSPQGYVTREAKISCSYGKGYYVTMLDAGKDYGVFAANGKPLLTCKDCLAGINIHSFGNCFAEIESGRKFPRLSGTRVGNIGGKWIYKCIPEPVGPWRQKESGLLLEDAESGKFNDVLVSSAYLTCRYGGIITIEELADNKNTKELAEEAYQVLRQWLLEGFEIVSQEALTAAMEELALNGDINKISCLNEPVMPENKGEKTDEEEVEIEMLKRIKSCMSKQDKYDVMVLAWVNYWNMTMEKKYGEIYAQIRPDIIKAMILDESNLGQENTVEKITHNPERDVMQSVDPRNPVIWIVIGKEPNEYIVIQRAESDVQELEIDENEEVKARKGKPGAGQVRFFETGSYRAAKEIVSEDLQIYYAGKVTPELSIAIGVGCYCMNLNGTMADASQMRSEVKAIKRYNGGGDKYYVKKINVILDNMGVGQLEE